MLPQEPPHVQTSDWDKTDYYLFGMKMPNRNIEGKYRYGYQGQEKDPEIGMEAFELRLWDGRIGRWLTTDPYGEFHSPYMGMGNNPISRVDPDGGCTDCAECPSACGDLGITSIPEGQSIDLNIDTGYFMQDGLGSSLLNEVIVTAPSQSFDMNTSLWDFTSQIQNFQNATRAIIDRGGIPNAYSIQGYLDSYEQAALTSGRSYVTGQDIDEVDGAVGELMMTIVPVGRILNLAGKGYTLTRTIGKFHIIEKTIKASHLSGHARSVFQKVYNQQGKLIRVRKIDYKIDGRMFQSKPKFPNFPDSRKLH